SPSSTLDDLPAIEHLQSPSGARDGSRAACGQDEISRDGSRQAKGQSLHPVTEIVDVARGTPPAAREQPRAALGLYVRHILDAGVVGLGAEEGLLVVGRAENVQSRGEDDR